ncbi:hypothetical protein DFH06DRAFT_1213966 [Mycena polygramma]|nr:hypothetical protein DFH06DRAFT_1213966 [Mycena polygramma]
MSKNAHGTGPPQARARIRTKAEAFPSAWLEDHTDTHVIDRTLWNSQPVPARRWTFSVSWAEYFGTRFLTHWTYGVEIVGIIMRLYYGIAGCIVPVVFLPLIDLPSFIFTIAGPAGEKEFYWHIYDTCLETNELLRLTQTFSSVGDFYRNCDLGQREPVDPVAGGAEATRAAFVECGFRKPKKEHPGPLCNLDWDSIFARQRALNSE